MNFEADNVPAELLPKPVGWRILIAPIKIEELSTGGIALPGGVVKNQEFFRNIAKVIAMGSECYKHPKFQGGISLDKCLPTRWCEVGDIIQYSSYTGADIFIQYENVLSKLKVINDDEVVCKISDLSTLNFI